MTVGGSTEVCRALPGFMTSLAPRSVISSRAMAIYAMAILTLSQTPSVEAVLPQFGSALAFKSLAASSAAVVGASSTVVVSASSAALVLNPVTWLVAGAFLVTGFILYQTAPRPGAPSIAEIAAELGVDERTLFRRDDGLVPVGGFGAF